MRTTTWGSSARRRRIAGVCGALAVVLTAGGLAFGVTSPDQADVTSGLLLDYPLDEFSGTVVHGHLGQQPRRHRQRDRRLGRQGRAEVQRLHHLRQAADSLMSGLSSITVDFDVWTDPSLDAPYSFFSLGNTSGSSGNGYLSATGNKFRAAITTGDSQGEQGTQPAAAYQLSRGLWKHVT
ncbi:hypothetical protein ACQEWB_48635 [Streptomyces sp. CA-249302]|uniref:hypothetical protein n=1 Tax=Streptomyces sp. CA-249302 TaxID=3240058 RepID=UPI003D915E5C